MKPNQTLLQLANDLVNTPAGMHFDIRIYSDDEIRAEPIRIRRLSLELAGAIAFCEGPTSDEFDCDAHLALAITRFHTGTVNLYSRRLSECGGKLLTQAEYDS